MHWLVIAALVATPKLPHGKQKAPSGQQTAEQLSPEEVRRRAEAYLGTIDTPIRPEQWKALGPRAADVLEPIVTDTKEMPTRRAHALDGLVLAAPQRAAPLVGKIARDESQPTVVRVAALHGAPRVLPSSKLVSELKPVLQKAGDPGMRSVAADVLARHGKQAGCTAVKAQAAKERDNAGFEKPLERCQ